jgi:hypothetical protein
MVHKDVLPQSSGQKSKRNKKSEEVGSKQILSLEDQAIYSSEIFDSFQIAKRYKLENLIPYLT